VSALIGFDREQQTEFRSMANNAPYSELKRHAEYRRRLQTIILQAIADLEVGPSNVAEQPTESGKPIDVFISYSAVDREIAEKLANCLRALQLTVFLSHDTITTGPAWRSQVRIALRRCAVGVLLLSTDSLRSDWVRYEIGALWALNKPVAPALLDCDVSQIPEMVREFQARSVASESNRIVFCHEVERLVRDTRTEKSGNRWVYARARNG
jgi:hypothetical protein